jgi:hypothetical protein
MTDFQPSLTPLTHLAAKRGVLLAATLERYQQQWHLTDSALARQLQISEEQLTHLKLCDVPREEHFAEDVRQIADHIPMDAARLVDILRP